MFEKLFQRGPEKEKGKKETFAGEEVVGSIPAEFTVEEDGKTTKTRGSIKVLYNPEMGSEGGFSDEKEGE